MYSRCTRNSLQEKSTYHMGVFSYDGMIIICHCYFCLSVFCFVLFFCESRYYHIKHSSFLPEYAYPLY